MANILSINQYRPKKTDEFLFDTNIWIYITIPALSHDQKLEQEYSNFFAMIRKQGATILTSFVIISEFVNRYLRHELVKYNKKNNVNITYKTFKQKPEYEKSFKYITSIVNQIILPNCEIISTPTEIIEADTELYNYSQNCDLNDNYIIELSKHYKCFLVSSDKYLIKTTDNINVLFA